MHFKMASTKKSAFFSGLNVCGYDYRAYMDLCRHIQLLSVWNKRKLLVAQRTTNGGILGRPVNI